MEDVHDRGGFGCGRGDRDWLTARLADLDAGDIETLVAISPTAERLFEGHATMVIDGGRAIDSKLRRLGLRRSELEHAVRLQNGDDIGQVDYGRLEPGGQLVLTLKTRRTGRHQG